MKEIRTRNYVRISKKTAGALYRTGQQSRVFFYPVNLNPESPWGLLWNAPNNDISFEKIVSEYEYYNCDNARGRYTAFYVPREWYELRQAVALEFVPGVASEFLERWEAANQ